MMEFSRLKNRMTARLLALQSTMARDPDSAQSLGNRNFRPSRQAIAGAACDRLCV